MRIYRRRKASFWERLGYLSWTTWIIIASVAMFLVEVVALAIDERSINYFALNPSNIAHGKYLWTIVLHIFAHGNLAHLFINMFVLFSLGSLIERIIGRKRYIWFYLISGIFAGALSVAFALAFGNSPLGSRIFGSPDSFMVGASGAIFAIAGLYVVLLPNVRFMIIFLPFFSLPAYVMVPLALFGVWLASAIGGWSIGNVAHFGGFLAGVVYGVYLRIKYRRKVERLQRLFR
ncbi:rhomboid family intramembrane serine protease [Candidatus Pacearchaeota archaeon]|nr:MAG: rhomboid family intramembrane serine protease [Candidatus Pacearchaeota archaeon]